MEMYLDYSATTPPRREVITKMDEVLTTQWGNPSSLHRWGTRAATILETARIEVASLINAPHPDNLIFTSGGTEADNLAIMGIARRYPTPEHIIISQVEHPAIAEPVKLLEQWGWEITRLPVNAQGRVNPLDLQKALRPNTVLVSIIYGQSEVGTLQPIDKLGAIARDHGVLFHTDAVQVAGKLPIDVQKLPVDLLSLSSHKIYGPLGAGALYVAQGVKLVPLLLGGGQERGLRSGTQAVPVIAGFGVAAAAAAAEMSTETPRLITLRDRLFHLLSECTHLIPTGDRTHRLPHHLSFCLAEGKAPSTKKQKEIDLLSLLYNTGNMTGNAIVRKLNEAGIGISAGSACHSGKLMPSSVLLAMGYSESEAMRGIRLTLGRDSVLPIEFLDNY
ncbi:MAG: cysteine desulfurase [Prochloron sp. SP5CPC1]|nr:cysteine desulfurase [Candidatus Paraprochloron terpiosi SP5CPC1]